MGTFYRQNKSFSLTRLLRNSSSEIYWTQTIPNKKAGFDDHVEIDLEPNFCEIILTCAIILNGLNPHSIDSTNIEINYTLKLAWGIQATLFGASSNSAINGA